MCTRDRLGTQVPSAPSAWWCRFGSGVLACFAQGADLCSRARVMTLQGLVVDCVMLTWHGMCICGCGVVCVGQSSVQLWRARSVRCLYACVPAVLPSQFSCAVVPASLRRSAHMLHRVVRPGWCPMARPVIHARPQACRMCRRRRGIVAAGGWARCDSWVHRGSLGAFEGSGLRDDLRDGWAVWWVHIYSTDMGCEI